MQGSGDGDWRVQRASVLIRGVYSQHLTWFVCVRGSTDWTDFVKGQELLQTGTELTCRAGSWHRPDSIDKKLSALHSSSNVVEVYDTHSSCSTNNTTFWSWFLSKWFFCSLILRTSPHSTFYFPWAVVLTCADVCGWSRFNLSTVTVFCFGLQ